MLFLVFCYIIVVYVSNYNISGLQYHIYLNFEDFSCIQDYGF